MSIIVWCGLCSTAQYYRQFPNHVISELKHLVNHYHTPFAFHQWHLLVLHSADTTTSSSAATLMEHFKPTAKSGSDWTIYELIAYNIKVIQQTKQEFFGANDLPVPSQPTVVSFMTSQLREDAPDEATRKLLYFLDLEANGMAGFRAAPQNLVARLLETLGYDSVGRIIFFQRTIPFLTCGVDSVAEPDFCLLKDSTILLMVLHRRSPLDDPEPPIIAAAIAAYTENNKHRPHYGYTPLPAITFPAITLTDTNFIFYKITVTDELSRAVALGIYPATKTEVIRYVPVLPSYPHPPMYPLKNRVVLLACLEAFKQFIED